MSAEPQPLRLIEGNASYTSYLTVSGARVDVDEANSLFRAVVVAEIANWVPDVSQRLIRRASAVLFEGTWTATPDEPDHGPDRAAHNLVPHWVCGLYVMCCSGCHRLYEV